MKSVLPVILNLSLFPIYRERMKQTAQILSVKGRLLPFGNAQGKLMNSFVRNLAMTIQHPDFSPDLSEKIKPTIPVILSLALAKYRRMKPTAALRYVPHPFSKRFPEEKKIGTALLSVTKADSATNAFSVINALKSVILSDAPALYRRMKLIIPLHLISQK